MNATILNLRKKEKKGARTFVVCSRVIGRRPERRLGPNIPGVTLQFQRDFQSSFLWHFFFFFLISFRQQ